MEPKTMLNKEELIKLSQMEVKVEQVVEDISELKEDVKETRETLIALLPKIDALIVTVAEIKAKQDEGFTAFFNKNTKIVIALILLAFFALLGQPMLPLAKMIVGIFV